MKPPRIHVWHTITVDLKERSYDILIGPGILSDVGLYLERIFPGRSFYIISDSNVHDLIGIDMKSMLEDQGFSCKDLEFPAGESSKNLETVERLCRELVRIGADRQGVVIALGGGVTGDIAGFVASIYMRGIPFVQVPTSLLAQVDSSVGGKTGVDLPEGKNLVGTFYQPSLVISDIGVLATLPRSELKNGIAEVIKYGAIWDKTFFSFLEERIDDVLSLDPDIIAQVVRRSCEIKAEVVSRDEREGDLRRILNFGHTIGHAVEASSNFTISHGEAVAMGMVAEAWISVEKGLLAMDDLKRLKALIKGFELPGQIPGSIPREHILSAIRHDKKVKAGTVHFVLLKGLGRTIITPEVTDEEIMGAIQHLT